MDTFKNFNPETAKNTRHIKIGEFETYVVDYPNIERRVNKEHETVVLDDTQYTGPLVSSELYVVQRSDYNNRNRFLYQGSMSLANSIDVSAIQEEFFEEVTNTCKELGIFSVQDFYFNNNRLLICEIEGGKPALTRLGVYPGENIVNIGNEGSGNSSKYREVGMSLTAPNIDTIEGQIGQHFIAQVAAYVISLNALCRVLYGGNPDPQRLVMTANGPLYQDEESGQYLEQQKFKKVILGQKKDKIEKPSEDSVSIDKRQSHGDHTPKGMTLDDIGGLEAVRKELKMVASSFKNAESMKMRGVKRPNGIFMYGPPGTGKTTLATALANEIDGSLWEIKVSDIKDKWHGNSERNMQEIFDKARSIDSPTVMLFDEFETMINTTDGSQSSASASDNAVAGIFKKEATRLLDENENIILVAATNYDDRVDESLIRPGRFDLKLYVPLPDENARVQIFANKIADMINMQSSDDFTPVANGVDPTALALETDGMSGADIDAILRKTAFNKAIQDGDKPGSSGPITQEDILKQINDFRTQ